MGLDRDLQFLVIYFVFYFELYFDFYFEPYFVLRAAYFVLFFKLCCVEHLRLHYGSERVPGAVETCLRIF